MKDPKPTSHSPGDIPPQRDFLDGLFDTSPMPSASDLAASARGDGGLPSAAAPARENGGLETAAPPPRPGENDPPPSSGENAPPPSSGENDPPPSSGDDAGPSDSGAPESGPFSPRSGGPLAEVMDSNFLQFASYAICDRAIPTVEDGLKPVQRRILHTLSEMDDGRFVKVATVVGRTMFYHPHGDASIYGALVNLANKRYLIEGQGNFGNIYTGDEAAAPR